MVEPCYTTGMKNYYLSALLQKPLAHVADYNQNSAPAKKIDQITSNENFIGIWADGKIIIMEKTAEWTFGGSDRTAWVNGFHLSW